MTTRAIGSLVPGALLAVAGIIAPSSASGQSDALDLPAISVESNLPADGFVSRNAAIELRVAGTVPPGDRLAVFLGATDVTPLFRPTGSGVRYTPRVVGLQPGEREMIVYVVRSTGEWEELRRFPLRVRSAAGYDRASLAPALDLGVEGQLAEGHDAATPPPPRPTYQDFTGQLSLESGVERGPARWATQASIIGVSHPEAALRYGELGGHAPRVDLSNYVARFSRGPSELAVGHVALGNQRHLISGFSSRGAALTLRPGSRVDLHAGITNGTSVVGWYNPIGLNDPDHRVASGTVGIEALSRPGALRVELTGLSGSVRPLAGYNQGVVNDAEESQGLGFRVTASDPTQRVRLESGYARSRFDNPSDSTLAQGGDVVAVQEVTRNAHYVDGSVDVLRDLRLGKRTTTLSLGFRREKVDPLYRSLGAYAQPHRAASQYEIRATVAGIGLLGSHDRAGDNLANLASVLTSLTRRTGVAADAPLAAIIGVEAWWLPVLSAGVDRTHQFGEGIPENGEFAASHIPDQISRNRTLSANWQFSRGSLGYRWNSSAQDNRQVGRENADFDALANGVALGLRPARWLGLDLSFDLERAANLERRETDRTRRVGARTTITPFGQSTLALTGSHTRAADDAHSRRRRDTILDGNWSSTVPGLQRLGARYYLRFSRVTGRAVDEVFELDNATARWTLSSGLNVGLTRARR